MKLRDVLIWHVVFLCESTTDFSALEVRAMLSLLDCIRKYDELKSNSRANENEKSWSKRFWKIYKKWTEVLLNINIKEYCLAS